MKSLATTIVKKLVQKGHKAYFAGGSVRDLLMGQDSADIDIATSAKPDEILALFTKTFEKGKAFGVVSVLLEGQEFEVATFRKEGKYSDGRHPDSVTWTDDKQDALRRDFTINGMFYDPLTQKVIDYVGGQEDLKKKIIRTIGSPEHRFDEDKLRMMRAVRFSARFSYPMEENTKQAIVKMASSITEVSPERIREELLKILTQAHPHQGVDLLSQLGLLKVILPEIEMMKGVEQPPQFHPEGDVYIHTLLVLQHLKNPNPGLAMSALLHDVGKPPTFVVKERIRFDGHVEVGAEMAQKICRRLRFSNKETEHICKLILDHLKFMHVKQMRKSTLKRFLSQERFEDHLDLHKADCLGCHGLLENYEFCKTKLEELKKEPIPKKPLLSGHDLIRLGFKPGPLFKKILTAIETARLEGEIKTKNEGLKLAKHKFLSSVQKKNLKHQDKKKRPGKKK
ncbi:MAG: CCA tRNA nucleotidyltransferase [Deltaproteobacteria bacterium]|nr:CCA tRNA nucleotidyltransferase [Deltaproteobacteria bacterium]